jgi:hypothetical protein
MTSEEFLDILQQKSDLELLGPCLHEDLVPYVFEPSRDAWDMFRNELVSQLGVNRGDIRIVGSGRFGFSTKPWNKLARFRDNSDIDVIVVNTDAFDELWLSLLRAAYPRPPISQKIGGWLKKRRSEIYTGWITPLKIGLDARICGVKATGFWGQPLN